MYDNKIWRDYVGIGDAFDLNYRNSQEIKDAMKKDDLLSLEKNLTSEKISKNKRRGKLPADRYCNRLAESCEFPDEKELYDMNLDNTLEKKKLLITVKQF